MKKLCILLCLLLVLAPCAGAQSVPANPAAAPANPGAVNANGASSAVVQAGAQNTGFEQVDSQIFQNQWGRFEELMNSAAPIILSNPDSYKYTGFAEDISYEFEALLDAAQAVFDSKGEPTVEDYIDVLAALMVLCDANSSLSSAESTPAGIGSTLPGALYDALNIALTSEFANLYETPALDASEKAVKKQQEDISSMITMLLDSTEALYAETENMIAFDNAVKSYLCCDRLLAEIEAHSEGDLKTAASLLKYTNAYRVTASLQTILEVGTKADVVSLLTGGEISLPLDIVAEAASFDNKDGRLLSYGFAAIDGAYDLLKTAGVTNFIDYWEIMKSGGSIISDIGFGLGTVSERICEIRVLTDVAKSLSDICREQMASVYQPDEQLMRDTLLTLRALLYCHMQGESTLYYMVTQEMGLMSLIAFSNEKEFDLWYLKKKQTLHTYETLLNNVMHSWGLVGAVVPQSDPYTDFSKMEIAIERPDGYEIARTRLYDDGVYVFHEPSEMYVTLKLYIDGKLHKTIKDVTLDVEGSSYVQQDIFLFDSPYPTFVKELVEQYGRSDLSRQQAQLSWGSGTDSWPQRRGIAAAEVIDLNLDGYEELLVYRFVSNGNDTSQPNALKLYVYHTTEQGEVELAGRIDLLESRTRAYCSLRAGIVIEHDEYPRIYTERIERAADGYSIAYESHQFDGYTLQRVHSLSGSTDYYGALSIDGSNDSIDHRILLWFGDGAAEFDYYSVSDLGEAEWASFDVGEALNEGMHYLDFFPFADRSHNDEGWVKSFPARYDYPISFEYFCQGSDMDIKDTWAVEQSMLDELLMQAEE